MERIIVQLNEKLGEIIRINAPYIKSHNFIHFYLECRNTVTPGYKLFSNNLKSYEKPVLVLIV